MITISIVSIFTGISFILGLVGFWSDGAGNMGILFAIGLSVFALSAFLIIRTSSEILTLVGVVGFGVFSLLGVSTHIGIPDTDTLIVTKTMALVLLI